MTLMQDFFKMTSKILEIEYQRSGLLKHAGMKGIEREAFISNFLERTFPKKYIIGTGEIIDSKNNISKQADIVIYDEFMPIFDYGKCKHFLSGGTLVHIEVKSRLDSEELLNALELIKTIKNLNRDIDSGLSIFPIATNKIPSFIFAYEGISKETFKKTFSEFYKDEKNIDMYVDCVCVLNQYTARLAFKNNQPPRELHFVNTQEDSLMLFFETLFGLMYKNWLGFPQLDKYIGNLSWDEF
jgi:hypothetical protein